MMRVVYHFSRKWSKQKNDKFELEYLCSSLKPNCRNVSSLFNRPLEEIETELIDYSLCLIAEDKVEVITDRYGTIPVYYATSEEFCYVSDSLAWIVDQTNASIDKNLAIESVAFDMIMSKGKTIYKHVYRVPSGVKFDILKSKVIDSLKVSYPEGLKDWQAFQKMLPEIKEQLLDMYIPQKSYFIPLSGGMDSRLVLACAMQKSPFKVLSRTFGHKSSLDVKYGSKVAQLFKIEHNIVSKNSKESIEEFERMVCESAGSVSGVHGHDIEGRQILESKYDIKVSGFIGDVLARGTLMKVNATKESANSLFKQKSSLSIEELKFMSNSISQAKADYDYLVSKIDEFVKNEVMDINWLAWDFYEKRRIPNLISLLEYQTHLSKPNLKPFLHKDVRAFIASSAALNAWPGEAYCKLAAYIEPALLDIPLASNSIFKSKTNFLKFKLNRKFYSVASGVCARISQGRINLGSYNQTLNWNKILYQEQAWALENLAIYSEFVGFDINKVRDMYYRVHSGRGGKTFLLLRMISIAILLKSRYVRSCHN